MARLGPDFPKSHGKPRVDGRRVLSGIIFINRNGLRGCDAPREYGPHKTLHDRRKRWSETGVFARILAGLAAEEPEEKTAMIDGSTRTPCVRVSLRKYLKTRRTATSLAVKKGGVGAGSDARRAG